MHGDRNLLNAYATLHYARTDVRVSGWVRSGTSQISLRYLYRTSLEPAPNQLRIGSEQAPNRFGASSEPGSVMEFGFTIAPSDLLEPATL